MNFGAFLVFERGMSNSSPNEIVFLLGAVLIFLPGYDEIVSLREKIYDDKTFADNTR